VTRVQSDRVNIFISQ